MEFVWAQDWNMVNLFLGTLLRLGEPGDEQNYSGEFRAFTQIANSIL